MKILRNDATGFEAVQGRVAGMIMGVIFTIVGVAVSLNGIMNGQADHNKLAVILVGLAFAVIGIGVFLFVKRTRIVVDLGAQTFTISFKSVARHSEFVEPIADIVKVVEISILDMTTNTNGRGSTPTVEKTLQIILKTGDAITVPLNTSSRSLNGIPLGLFGHKPEVGQLLATALGVPFEPLGFNGDQMMNTASSIVNQVASGSFGSLVHPTATPVEPVIAATETEPPVDPTPPQPPASFGRSL